MSFVNVKSLQRQLENKEFFMLGSISLHGLCPTDLPGESSGHPGMSSCIPAKALSYGLSRQGLTKHSGTCQPGKRWANICRFCPCSHTKTTKPLYRRSFWCTIETNCICTGFHHHRSLSVIISMGYILQAKKVQ